MRDMDKKFDSHLFTLCFKYQMLSMRNGLSLHPICLLAVLQPIQFSQTRMDFGEENGSLPMNVLSIVLMNQETST